MPHEHHDHPVHHDRRSRGGHHADLPRDPEIGIVGTAVRHVLSPPPPVADEVRNQVDDARLRKVVQWDRCAPILEGPARLGVERPEEEPGCGDEDDSATVHFSVSDAFPVRLPGRALVPDGLGLAEGPEGLARGGIDRDHLAARSGHRVKHAVDVDRRRPVEVVDVGPEVVAPPYPRLFQILEVVGVDLRERRGARVAGVAAQIAPCAVLGAGQALGESRA